MNKYLVEVAVTMVGIQTFSVEAGSPNDAMAFVRRGDGECLNAVMDTVAFNAINVVLNG